MKMTVSQLRQLLQELEKADCGDYQIKFHCESRKETNFDGTGAVVLPPRTFDFYDLKYDFKFDSYVTNDGYPCKVTNCTDNINVNSKEETVTFHQF